MSKKLKFSAVLMFCMLALSVLSVHTVQAANTNKKTLTGTIGGNNSFRCELKLKKEANLKIEIKILDMSGKGKNQQIYWVPYHNASHSKGSLFYDLNPSKLKKNKTLRANTFLKEKTSKGSFYFDLPEGIKKMKVKVTISTVDETKSIQSFKKTIYPAA